MSHKSILRAVIKRAFDDVSLFYKSSKDKEAATYAKSALLWIQGADKKDPAILDEPALDQYMAFSNLCSVLRLPYAEMVTYATMIAEGTHEQFHETHPVIVWASDEHSDDAQTHNVHLANRAESFLRNEWVISTDSDFTRGEHKCEDSER